MDRLLDISDQPIGSEDCDPVINRRGELVERSVCRSHSVDYSNLRG